MSHDTKGDSPLLICKLVARNIRTIDLWKHPENSSRYGPPSYIGNPEHDRSGRESSLSDDDSDADPDQEPELYLTFDKMPKDVSQGFVFGSNPELCDIFCGKPDQSYRICNRTFSITINDEGHVVLEHMTQKTVTSVQYSGQKPGTRRRFTWIFFPRSSPLFVTAAKKLHFEVILPDHGDLESVYQTNVELYLKARRDAILLPGPLDLGSQPTSMVPSTLPVPNLRRFYYKVPDAELGRGTYGRVYEVQDVSNGNRYAAKEFLGKFDLHEISMLSALKHEHIVSYIDHTEEDTPMLIMEYMEGNDLRKQGYKQRLSFREVTKVLYQMLLSVQYLHGQPRRIVHRDIKPENILFKTRNPLHAKLGDFGTAWNGSVVNGMVGTPEYFAPEICSYQPYDRPVDIWSLGVVILEMLWQPGCMASSFHGHRQGLAWCKYIVQLAEHKSRASASDVTPTTTNPNLILRLNLVLFLSTYMLKMDPKERSSAEFCLNAGMSPTFRLWGQFSDDDQNLASVIDPVAALQQSQTEGHVGDMTDPPTPRPGSRNSRAVTEVADQSEIRSRALDHAPLYASNRNNPQDISDREDRGNSNRLPQMDSLNTRNRQPRHIIIDRLQREIAVPQGGRKRGVPDDGSGRDLGNAEHAQRLAPYQYKNLIGRAQDDAPPPDEESPKRARLAQEHNIPDQPPPPPAA